MNIVVHCMVRNEPFVWYALKSVYPFVDTILLYDTGSYDKHTIEDIHLFLRENDPDNKVVFQQVRIETDETKWSVASFKASCSANKGKYGKGHVRLKMIEDSPQGTVIMVLDGDEVHYQKDMRIIREFVNNWPEGKVAARIKLHWYCTLNDVFKRSVSHRLFLNDGNLSMRTGSPGEMHLYNGRRIDSSSSNTLLLPEVSYAHFETYLKPWRRKVGNAKLTHIPLPEVMQENPYFSDRFSSYTSNTEGA